MIGQRVLYGGRVQGVGFRATTADLAREFVVMGQVRNLPDGRVELIVEGDAIEVERFLGAVESAFDGFIREQKRTTQPASGYYKTFRIVY